MTLTDSQIKYARRKLAEYDLRKPHAYKNQMIGLRNDIRMMTGLGIRDLRALLDELDARRDIEQWDRYELRER